MSDYIADFNSAVESDVALSLAINARDSIALAHALNDGGGEAGSSDLEFLLAVAVHRKGPIEIVRFSTTGRAKAALKSVDCAAYLRAGIPAEVRVGLIADLQSGRVAIQSRKNRGAGAGRPRETICPDAAAGADIHAIALGIAQKAHPDLTAFFGEGEWAARHWLVQAVEDWIHLQCKHKTIKLESEVNTLARKARRALRAYNELPIRFAKMANLPPA